MGPGVARWAALPAAMGRPDSWGRPVPGGVGQRDPLHDAGPRQRRVGGARAGAAAGVLGAVGAVVGVVAPRPATQPDPAAACRALAELNDALDLTTIADQAVVRVRGAALADALITQGFGDGRPDGSATVVGRRIIEVLDQPGATVADLVVVLAPVERQCAVPGAGRATG